MTGKLLKCGCDYVRKNGEPILVSSRAGALNWGKRNMPRDLKSTGFNVAVFEAATYFRVSFAK